MSSCGDEARFPLAAGTGPHPQLPPPHETLFPTVNIAPARGWSGGATPIPAPGLKVAAFADGLDHPRWLYVLPNGDVLVAETNAPPRPEDAKGIKGWIMKLVMRRAGAGVQSANRITLLRDDDGGGVARTRSIFLDGLNSPFGMALVGNSLYIADTDAVLRFPYEDGQTKITVPAAKVLELPAGPINHHWTKNLIASPDGRRLYVTVGSNSNVGENGVEAEEGRAAIWEVDATTGAHRTFASGLRNPVGLDWEPVSGRLWTAVNERDELGSDLVWVVTPNGTRSAPNCPRGRVSGLMDQRPLALGVLGLLAGAALILPRSAAEERLIGPAGRRLREKRPALATRRPTAPSISRSAPSMPPRKW